MKIHLKSLSKGALFATLFSFSAFVAHAYYISDVELLSQTSDGTVANADSYESEMTDDERYVVLESLASNLNSIADSGSRDVFLLDRTTGDFETVSLTPEGAHPNGSSDQPHITDDGDAIVYQSTATDLVTGDTNAVKDVFLYDTATNTNVLVSRATGIAGTIGNAASEEPAIFDSGVMVAFTSAATNLTAGDTNGFTDIFLRNIAGSTTSLISGGGTANGNSFDPAFSDSYLVFASDASNLVSGDTNGVSDIFIYDFATFIIERINLASGGVEANGDSYEPVVSDGGGTILFTSDASNLASGDTNGTTDVFIYKRDSGKVSALSVSQDGVMGNSASAVPTISDDGSWAAFASYSTNLVDDDTNASLDVFVRDLVNGIIFRGSVNAGGEEVTGHSTLPSLSSDGQYLLFASSGENMSELAAESGQMLYISEIHNGFLNIEVTDITYIEGSEKLSYTIENTVGNFSSDAELLTTITITNPDGSTSTVNDYPLADQISQSGHSDDFTEPIELEVGTSTIEVCIDSTGELPESNEDDNCDTLEVTIEGDAPVEDDPVVDDPVVDDDPTEDGTPLADDADDELTCDDPFTDTIGHWGEKTICLIYLEGTVSGKSEGIFEPDSDVTRAEILKMILLNSGEDIPLSFEESTFSDVGEEDWFYGYVMHGFDLEVVEGYDDGTFRPNEPVNRAEALTMLLRMANVDEESSTSGLDFTDLLADDWYYDEVGLGIDYGLVEGYDDDTFRPAGLITRAEAATIIRRAWYVWYNN